MVELGRNFELPTKCLQSTPGKRALLTTTPATTTRMRYGSECGKISGCMEAGQNPSNQFEPVCTYFGQITRAGRIAVVGGGRASAVPDAEVARVGDPSAHAATRRGKSQGTAQAVGGRKGARHGSTMMDDGRRRLTRADTADARL